MQYSPATGADVYCRRAVTPKTKMLIINTPHNPVGKVYTKYELEQIAIIAEEHNIFVMADEVVSGLVHGNEAPR